VQGFVGGELSKFCGQGLPQFRIKCIVRVWPVQPQKTTLAVNYSGITNIFVSPQDHD
tara:strand:- start:33135 stop:33305 length:171 start_codon:yes stop_codon:yes gene_type:complete